MSAASVLARVTEVGTVLVADSGRLVYRGPADALTPDLRAAVASHRAELVVLLTPTPAHMPLPGSQTSCLLCAPAPTLNGPALPEQTAVCLDCTLQHGVNRALALADLRRVEGRRAATHRLERGAWQRIPTSEELAHHIQRATRRKRAVTTEADGDTVEEEE